MLNSCVGLLVTTLVAGASCAERANACFTAHGKTSLECTKSLSTGPIDVFDDADKPQRKRTRYYSSAGKLCESKSCKKCMEPGGRWVPCAGCKACKLPVHTMSANGDVSKPVAVLIALAVVAVPVVVFRLLGSCKGSSAPTASAAPAASGAAGIASGVVDFLLRFASAWWFPLVAALGTAVNMFTIIFTAATVVLFLAALLGRRDRWVLTAMANAAGATLGTAVLLFLVRERGLEYLNETFPMLLSSPAWAKATGLMQSYGVGGMFLVSCMPIILHPVIAFGMLSNMSNTTILAIVMGGRTVKYLTMGWVTTNAPHALRFFGIKGSLVEYATKATAR